MDTKILICTLGGSPQPLIFSLHYHKPKKVLFFASADSAKAIEECILPHYLLPLDVEVCILTDEQNLALCRQEMTSRITRFIEKATENIWGDFTGGTKVMSVSLALSLQDFNIPLSYVGGNKRHKNGLGAVQDGEEVIRFYP